MMSVVYEGQTYVERSREIVEDEIGLRVLHVTLELEREWLFTFGVGHVLDGVSLMGRFVRIRGTYSGARAQMLERFGRAWCGQYESDEEAGVAKYRLVELGG